MITDVHKFVSKGWGYEKWVVNGDQYCGKILHMVKHKRLSLHYHKLKHETFFVHSGHVILIFYDDKKYDSVKDFYELGEYGIYTLSAPDCITSGVSVIELRRGDIAIIPQGRRHTLIAKEDSELIEFSTQHFDEDSYRILKGD